MCVNDDDINLYSMAFPAYPERGRPVQTHELTQKDAGKTVTDLHPFSLIFSRTFLHSCAIFW